MKIVVPWVCLCHDNHRLMPQRGRLVMAPAYRTAKATLHTLFSASCRGPLIMVPVAVHGIAYFPDNRKRDAGNYRKLLTDALTGTAYADDSQVHRETWERGPIDKANPRIELTVTPLETA